MDNIKSTYNSITSSSFGIFVVSCIILYVVVRFIIYMMQYSLTTGLANGVPLVPGKLVGSQTYNVKQQVGGDAIVGLSTNEQHGIEFTYSVWLKVNPDNFIDEAKYDISSCDFSNNCTSYEVLHIFNKGDDSYTSSSYNDAGSTYEGTPDGISLINNGPGVYLARYEKEVVILIYMDTIGTEPSAKRKPIIVRNMPIVKWFSLILIAKANVLYVYINGRLKHSKLFTDEVFKQNYDDINVNTSGVNWGDLSSLTYFPRALNGLEIQASVLAGPDRKKRIDTTTKFDESPSYLSSNWYAN